MSELTGFSMVFIWVVRAIKDEFKVKKVKKMMETCQLKYFNSLLSFYKSGIRLETCDSQGPIRKL